MLSYAHGILMNVRAQKEDLLIHLYHQNFVDFLSINNYAPPKTKSMSYTIFEDIHVIMDLVTCMVTCVYFSFFIISFEHQFVHIYIFIYIYNSRQYRNVIVFFHNH